MPPAPAPGKSDLILFADDWGNHPSSTQHLTRRLLANHDVLWVNTLGLRKPQLTLNDATRAWRKITRWFFSTNQSSSQTAPCPRVISPLMYPGFRNHFQKKINTQSMARCIEKNLAPRKKNIPRIAITTLPITADLMGRLDVDAWVYSCVDDFSLWPGSDGPLLREMEKQLIAKADLLIAASDSLREGMKKIAPPEKQNSIHLLTHGIDLEHWQSSQSPNKTSLFPPHWPTSRKPLILFWGLIDQRLDINICRVIAQSLGPQAALLFVGPQQSPDPALHQIPNLFFTGPVAYENLPPLAHAADLLVMPYADLPITRLIQPLKLKEYLATNRPVIVRDLPSTQPWSDACDLARNEKDFVALIQQRITTGLPDAQKQARHRLAYETWDAKAAEFEKLILTISPSMSRK